MAESGARKTARRNGVEDLELSVHGGRPSFESTDRLSISFLGVILGLQVPPRA